MGVDWIENKQTTFVVNKQSTFTYAPFHHHVWIFCCFSRNMELDLDFYASQYIYHVDICINYARNMKYVSYLVKYEELIRRIDDGVSFWTHQKKRPISGPKSKLPYVGISPTDSHTVQHFFCFNKNKQYFTLQKKAVL